MMMNHQSNASKPIPVTTHSRGIWMGRIAFLTTLALVAVLLGVLADMMLQSAEESLAKQQFKSIASRAVLSATLIFERKLNGVNAMTQIAANANPNAKDWPFVFIQGFEDIARELIVASDGRGMAFVPLVQAKNLAALEDFAYTYYNTTRQPEPFPPGAGIVGGIDKGIWGRLRNGTYYRDNQVERNYETDFEYSAPFLQHQLDGRKGNNVSAILMFNLRSDTIRGAALDSAIRCSLNGSSCCNQITNVTTLVTNYGEDSPSALLISPIFPSLNRTALPSGFVASSMVFFELFENLFGEEVDGILCVLETPHRTVEFLVERGQNVKIENGVFASLTASYRDIKAEAILTASELLDRQSPVYKLTLYPTPRFFKSYSTRNPLLASVGSVFIIALTGLLFMIYDFFVRREFSHKSELLETKRQFMRFVCHEVRTPLNSVCFGLSLIQDEMASALKSSGIELVDVSNWSDLTMEINQSAQRAVDVLSDLLNYDKIEQRNFSLELSVFSTEEVVKKTSSEFNLEAKRRGLNCTVQISPLQGYVLVGDVVRLTQVMRNLLSNALKFTSEGGAITITVQEEISSMGEGSAVKVGLQCGAMITVVFVGKARISVADSGAGMTKHQIDGLFRDGVQFNANELQAEKGSGIGLYIAKGIVDQHDGTLSCTSGGLDCGSTFVLELPLYKRLDKAHTSTTEECSMRSKSEDLVGGMHMSSEPVHRPTLDILVVDDSTTNVKLLMRLLQRAGHRCTGAHDGKEALDILKARGVCFDVLLLDFEMPVMNGPSTAEALRSMGCKSLIIGITGNMLIDDVRYFKDKGADEVLGKPISVGQIEDVITRYGVQGTRVAL